MKESNKLQNQIDDLRDTISEGLSAVDNELDRFNKTTALCCPKSSGRDNLGNQHDCGDPANLLNQQNFYTNHCSFDRTLFLWLKKNIYINLAGLYSMQAKGMQLWADCIAKHRTFLVTIDTKHIST